MPLRAVAAAEPDLHQADAVLLLIEDRGCPYCARWDREVRQGYLNSAEGHFAPLVRRLRGSPDIAFIPNVIYSPTFVLLVRGQEAGRIVGYQGPDFFWAELDSLLAKIGFKQAAISVERAGMPTAEAREIAPLQAASPRL